MQDALGPGTILGYCTNVHTGASFAQMKANLERFALPIKQRVSPDRPMGVGLWVSAEAMQEIVSEELALNFRGWLEAHGLLAYTVNGFPFDDFHQPVVKDAVYLPHWADEDRYQYTLGLATILADLLPPPPEEPNESGGDDSGGDSGGGSISTLPLGWPASFLDGNEPARMRSAADALLKLVHTLARIELDTGRHIHVDLEPEPGCMLETSAGVVEFFERYLLGGPDDVSVLSYLRVCHDVCHTAVMFEDQAEALRTYREAGIKVGKAQLSSAVRVDFDALDNAGKAEALARLRSFVEPRYLHQTSVRTDDGRVHCYVDLPQALSDRAPEVGQHQRSGVGQLPGGEWRVHFHVPVFLEDLGGGVGTTRDQIGAYLDAVEDDDETKHFEVETYAWDVLPPPPESPPESTPGLSPETFTPYQTGDLVEGIARELESVVAEFGVAR